MQGKFFIKPASGGIVRDPETMQPLPVDGAEKPRTAYWVRMITDGSVVETKPPKADKKEVTDAVV